MKKETREVKLNKDIVDKLISNDKKQLETLKTNEEFIENMSKYKVLYSNIINKYGHNINNSNDLTRGDLIMDMKEQKEKGVYTYSAHITLV